MTNHPQTRGESIISALFSLTAVGCIGALVYSCTQNSTTLQFNALNNADRCLSEVLDNKGVMRLPLPSYEGKANGKSFMLFSNTIAAEKASLLTPAVIEGCERETGTQRSAEWDKLIALRPR